MALTSIIIPTHNKLSLLEQCIYEIRRFTNTPFEIIVVDNGSTDGTLAYLQREEINFISFPNNRGFCIACNAGLRIASGEELLLLNNDVIVSRRWLSNMLACLSSSEEIGIVGPMTNFASGSQQHPLGYTTVDQFHQITMESNQPDPDKWQSVNRIVGMCYLFKRQLLESVGYLDEQYSPGHFEDDDYCYRARLKGYRLMIAGDTYVHHHGSKSFEQYDKEVLSTLLNNNRQKFLDKWGVDPITFI
jgi:GT2 family glycosyltransferase